ncbi:MAG TPA: transglycosylase family protein [Solirubrobacteraceae bacterium]|nr:transglycosylase family protein [Solirubrobacteraceae bacterium]
MRSRIRPARVRLPVAVSAVVALLGAAAAAVPLASSASPSIGTLQSRLDQTQARAQSLSARAGNASNLIARFDGQIALVSEREAAVQSRLTEARATLAAAQAAVTRERAVLTVLVARLARARTALSRQLVSQYESAPQNIVTVVLQAHGFSDLLDRLHYLHLAEGQEKVIVHVTMVARARAQSAAAELMRLEARDQATTDAVATEARAIAGMNALLRSKRAALERVRAIQVAQLAATHARQSQLSHELSVVEAQQAAANSAGSGSPVPYGGSAASGGWAIPYPIVLCESGGQNLTPNSAGASGYYQILPSTWRGAGGSGPAAYLAPKSEQDRVASILWNNGAGASNWVCSGIVGIH